MDVEIDDRDTLDTMDGKVGTMGGDRDIVEQAGGCGLGMMAGRHEGVRRLLAMRSTAKTLPPAARSAAS